MALCVNKRDITIIMEDLNAKIGKGKCGSTVEDYGLDTRNKRGDQLLQFCQKKPNNCQHLYKLPISRDSTHRPPASMDNKASRRSNHNKNQIHFIMNNEGYKNSIKSTRHILVPM